MYIMKMPKAKVLRGKVFAQLDLVRHPWTGKGGESASRFMCILYLKDYAEPQ